jgi:hypothetical protein
MQHASFVVLAFVFRFVRVWFFEGFVADDAPTPRLRVLER